MSETMLSLRIRGMLQNLVLYVLREGPLHGYGITYKISKLLDGVYKPSPGAIYPALSLLREKGLIELKHDGRRRVYVLTVQGLKELDRKKEEVEEFIRRIRLMVRIAREIGVFALLRALWNVSTKKKDEDEIDERRLAEARDLITRATNIILML